MQTATEPAVWVEIINKGTLAFVAVIAMIVGPVLQWRIAKRQTELQKSIAERQAELPGDMGSQYFLYRWRYGF
jgi:hypothetical protein